MSEDGCTKALEEASNILSSAGFPVTVRDGVLTSFFAVENSKMVFAYTAECTGPGMVEANAGVKGFEEEASDLECEAVLQIIKKLLAIPNEYTITIAMEEDMILFYYPPTEDHKAYTYVGTTFALSVSLAGWLSQAIEAARRGEPIQAFRAEIESGPGDGKQL